MRPSEKRHPLPMTAASGGFFGSGTASLSEARADIQHTADGTLPAFSA